MFISEIFTVSIGNEKMPFEKRYIDVCIVLSEQEHPVLDN